MTYTDTKLSIKLSNRLKNVHALINEYILISTNLNSVKSKIGYVNELIKYSNYQDFSLLDSVTKNDILLYLNKREITSDKGYLSPSSKNKIIVILRSFYEYLIDSNIVVTNPTNRIKSIKVPNKPIISLTDIEVAKMKDNIEDSEFIGTKQGKYRANFYRRDMAMITLLLETGIRNKELSELNIDHFDIDDASIIVTRKGGDTGEIGLSEEAVNKLSDYLTERLQINVRDYKGMPLFLNRNKKRIGFKGINETVKYYNPTDKKVTTHTMRKTFGRNLYDETGDIYFVADVLGHSNIETTTKYYVASNTQKRNEYLKNR